MSVWHWITGVIGMSVIVLSLGYAAVVLRRWVLPGWSGSPARLAELVLGLAVLFAIAQILGVIGLLQAPLLVAASAIVGMGAVQLGRTIEPSSTISPPGPSRSRGEVLIAAAFAFAVVVQWAGPVLTSLDRGMYGGDTLWYHLPFSAHMVQTGSTVSLLYVDTLYSNWFYPQNSELLHALGILLVGDDYLSPLINLGWLLIALLAGWCLGRPWGVAAPSSAAVAVLMSTELMFSRQPGNANNDVIVVALLLAAAAILANTWWQRAGVEPRLGERDPALASFAPGAVVTAGLAIGLSVGTKLNLAAIAVALTLGVILLSGKGERLRTGGIWIASSVLIGVSWFIRNAVEAGNPLPWFGVGPLEKVGSFEGRDPYSIAHYLTDFDVWGTWFAPGLAERLGYLWPLVLLLSAAGMALTIFSRSRILRMFGAVALAGFIAYFLTPLGAAGPEGAPTAFRLNIRYAAPAFALALCLVAVPPGFVARHRHRWRIGILIAWTLVMVIGNLYFAELDYSRIVGSLFVGFVFVALPLAFYYGWMRGLDPRLLIAAGVAVISILVVMGAVDRREYQEYRYSSSSPAYPVDSYPADELKEGIGAVNDWARGVTSERIGLGGTLAQFFQYGIWGPDASNQVEAIGDRDADGTFAAPAGCPEWVAAVNSGGYRYLVISPPSADRDSSQIEVPVEVAWLQRAPNAERIVSERNTGVWRIEGKLSPDICSP